MTARSYLPAGTSRAERIAHHLAQGETPEDAAAAATLDGFPPAQPQVWLTQQQAADRLGVHLRTIERHRAANRLPTYRAGATRALRFRVEDVDALMQPDPPADSTT